MATARFYASHEGIRVVILVDEDSISYSSSIETPSISVASVNNFAEQYLDKTLDTLVESVQLTLKAKRSRRYRSNGEL